MDKEAAKKLLDYSKKNMEPTHYKYQAIIYSDISIKMEKKFVFSNSTLSLSPYKNSRKQRYQYHTAFKCEFVMKVNDRNSGFPDFFSALDTVLTFNGIYYELSPSEILEWQKFEKEWLGPINRMGDSTTQQIFPTWPEDNIEDLIIIFEKIKLSTGNKSKKVNKIFKLLKKGVRLSNISFEESFLCFYKVIEIISDDLKSKKYIGNTDNEILKQIIELGVFERNSQKAKIFYLLKVFNIVVFPTEDCLNLANIRNQLSHSSKSIDIHELTLCKKLSFQSFFNYIKT